MAPSSDRPDSRPPPDLSPPDHPPPGLPPPEISLPPHRPHLTPARFTGRSRMTDPAPLDVAQVQASSSFSDEHLHPPRNTRSGHGRSMSNPFPSLFSSMRKKQSRVLYGRSDSDESDGGGARVPKSQGKSHPGPSRNDPTGSRDFVTGQCMTCASLVRWPRELAVFRCTICSTINDLQPTLSEGRRERPEQGRWAPEEASGLAHRSPSSNPISLEHSRALITQCIKTYLDAALTEPSRDEDAGSSVQATQLHDPSLSRGGNASNETRRVVPIQMSTLSPPVYGLGPSSDGSADPNNPMRRNSPMSRSFSTSYPERRRVLHDMASHKVSYQNFSAPGPDARSKRIFGPLENYLVSSLASFQSLNSSFVVDRASFNGQLGAEPVRQRPWEPRKDPVCDGQPVADLDPKLLLLGDIAENGSWWTGGQEDPIPARVASHESDNRRSLTSQRSPRIDWGELGTWYSTVINCGQTWLSVYHELVKNNPSLAATDARLKELEAQLLLAQDHAQRLLLKATETILKRPSRPIIRPSELRFLLIILANPLLTPSYRPFAGVFKHPDGLLPGARERASHAFSGRHSGIIKRILGLISNTPNECQSHLVSWFARYPQAQFIRTKDLVGSFLTYRLMRQSEKKQEVRVDITGGLIPNMSAATSAASLRAALSHPSGSSSKQGERQKKTLYHDDWQIRAAAQVMALIFAANNSVHSRPRLPETLSTSRSDNAGLATRNGVQARGQILPTSDFYTTFLDDADLLADFEAWELRRGKFSFCQYPFLLSIWAKIQILEYDARRQMQTKARDAFFDSITSNRAIEQHLVLNVRRDCLVEDSLKAVSEVIGSASEDIKKGLRITFRGEEGVDAGGLRKEWFLLLVREVFNPDHGMFVYDEDSQYCYFNPNSFETSAQFFLIGVVFGLAIYNSTILDVALPPFAFRKLLMAAPAPAASPAAISQPQAKPTITYNLDDLAEYRPRLAKGLRQLLEYEGDVESTFSLEFVVGIDKYGSLEHVPLCIGGERLAVTNANRREYVDLYVRYLLDTSVSRQFEPFKRGFFTVCGGNALSLFRPEEIELLVRGSDEPLDVASLKAVANYGNWGGKNPAESEKTIQWFWQTFEEASPEDQRKLLLFVTGSDRIPAMGAASLSIRITCNGDDCGRYPTAHTCFNVLSLSRYKTPERLKTMLWTAVRESEGFGLK